MVLNNYRHLLPRFVDGPVNWCVKKNITPNQISVAGFLVSCLAAITYAFPQLFLYKYFIITPQLWWHLAWIPPVLFFLGSYIDVLDGSLARKTNQASKFGAFLDSTLDRISDAVVILGLLYSEMIWPWNDKINNLIAFVCLSTMLLISYTRSRAELEGVVMKGIGFMERAERIFILIGGYLLEWMVFAIEEQFYGGRQTEWVFPVFFLIFTAFCLQTLYARVNWAYMWLNDKMPEKKADILAVLNQPVEEKAEKAE